MKIVEHYDLLRGGSFPESPTWKRAWNDVQAAVAATDWPHGSGTFTIRPESGKKSGEGNGVKPIKVPCIKKLAKLGWATENLPDIEKGVLTCGDLDALLSTRAGNVAFEWETGNISSSHRALNKLMLATVHGGVVGSFLVVPSDRLKAYLTDRIGNIAELRPYFSLWQRIPVPNGIVRIVVAEHDRESSRVRRIPKGTDGRALR